MTLGRKRIQRPGSELFFILEKKQKYLLFISKGIYILTFLFIGFVLKNM